MHKIIFILVLIVICVEIFLEDDKPMQRLFREINTTDRKVSMAGLEKLNFLSKSEKKDFVSVLLYEAKKDEHHFTRMGFLNLLRRYKLVNANDHQFVMPILSFSTGKAQAKLVSKILKLMMSKKTGEVIVEAYKTDAITFPEAVKFLGENEEALTALADFERTKLSPRSINEMAAAAIDNEPILFEALLLMYNSNAAERKQISTFFLHALENNRLDEKQALRVLKILHRNISEEQIPQFLAIIRKNLQDKNLILATVRACAMLQSSTDDIAILLKKLMQDKQVTDSFLRTEIEINILTVLLRVQKYQSFAVEHLIKNMRYDRQYVKLLVEQTSENPRVDDVCFRWLEADKENVPSLITKFLAEKQHERAFLAFVAIADELVFVENKYYQCRRVLSALSKYKDKKPYVTKKFMQYLEEVSIRPIIKCDIISYIRDMGVEKVAIPTLVKLQAQSVDSRVLVQAEMTLRQLGYNTGSDDLK
ncbi:hypothetical protein [Candidatus Uabimicrobium amorphum]|uniref:Uncharacterized protein n=1 Tax=Uabimicrobium amorphum TaxID=2596890 RepID=A0A5S9IRH8_UABAM|nr:hypothetical protein [Candidatus Uabimicrobium amorphum]BBM86783.1 hypothetical protein UABAM_05171 [Candidatus Uabimicrobium amorphum]